MTDNEWMTVSEASEKVNIPVETMRRYIRSHSVHLRVKKQGKKYLLHDDSMTVIKQIRALYDRSMNVDEVEETLSASGIPMTITVKNSNDEAMTVHVADELKEIKQALQEQKLFNQQQQEHLQAQREFNKLLLEQLKQQQEYIDRKLEVRDQRLLESIRAIQEVKQAQIEAAAAAKQEKDQRGFWIRLFNR